MNKTTRPIFRTLVFALVVTALFAAPSLRAQEEEPAEHVEDQIDDPGQAENGPTEDDLNLDTAVDVGPSKHAVPPEPSETSIGETPAAGTDEPAPAPPEETKSADLSPGGDEPNVSFERRLFRISKNLKPVSDEKWTEMVGSKKEDVYIVQSGDTLWDISQTLFGDGFFWSKLWAENSGLENPHRIGKGQGIRFVGGNEESAPVVNVVSAKEAESIKINAFTESRGAAPVYRNQVLKELSPEELADKTKVEVDEIIDAPEIPPMHKSRSVLRVLPRTFISKQPPHQERYDNTGLDAPERRSLSVPAAMVPNSYILDSAPNNIGLVEEVEASEQVASIGQYVFVRMKHPVRIGQKFSTIFVKGKIADPVRGNVGPVVEVGGVVEITAIVKDSTHVYRAAVIGAINPVVRDSLVIEETLPKASFARRGTRLDVEARIIGGEYDQDRKVIGENSVVYLDKGKNADLKPGDILPVQARRGERRDDTKYPDWRRPIGILKVVKVERTVSTAIVVNAQEEITPGDRTGGALPEHSRAIKTTEDPLSQQ